MKVLVIGGAGYIGSHVVLDLLEKGHQITVYDNLSSGREENLFKESNFIHADILDQPALDQAFSQGFDALVHLAAFKAAGESMDLPGKYAENNISGTINIINAALKHNCQKFVFSSSAAVYGEPQYLPIDENHPKSPENFYGFSKLKIEEILQWFDKLKGLRFASLRYFNAAGYDPAGRICGLEKNPANLLPVIMEVAVGMREKLAVFGDDYDTADGSCVRDYIHVSDLASAHTQSLEYIAKQGRSLTVNLGSESGVSVLEMLEKARKISGQEIPSQITERRKGDPARLVASSALAKEILGWKPAYSDVENLISSTYNVYQKNKNA